MQIDPNSYRLVSAEWCPSPNFDDRDDGCEPEVIIIHCISLPPGQYGTNHIKRFFQNSLAKHKHSYFESIAELQVSSHFLIDRLGVITQFVATDKRAWHAGESMCYDRPKVNNFSIGIELEGWDEDEQGFSDSQYNSLAELTGCLTEFYPQISHRSIFAHSDIAPGRKPDPGPYFDWDFYYSLLDNSSI